MKLFKMTVGSTLIIFAALAIILAITGMQEVVTKYTGCEFIVPFTVILIVMVGVGLDVDRVNERNSSCIVERPGKDYASSGLISKVIIAILSPVVITLSVIAWLYVV